MKSEDSPRDSVKHKTFGTSGNTSAPVHTIIHYATPHHTTPHHATARRITPHKIWQERFVKLAVRMRQTKPSMQNEPNEKPPSEVIHSQHAKDANRKRHCRVTAHDSKSQVYPSCPCDTTQHYNCNEINRNLSRGKQDNTCQTHIKRQ